MALWRHQSAVGSDVPRRRAAAIYKKGGRPWGGGGVGLRQGGPQADAEPL